MILLSQLPNVFHIPDSILYNDLVPVNNNKYEKPFVLNFSSRQEDTTRTG